MKRGKRYDTSDIMFSIITEAKNAANIVVILYF